MSTQSRVCVAALGKPVQSDETACEQLLDAASEAGEIRRDTDAYELLRGVGDLCVGGDNDPRYDARRMVDLLIAGLRSQQQA